MDICKKIIVFIFILICQQTYAQNEYPKDYFRSPMDIPLYLSGNFGELRTNHFHTGLDIKTQGVEGKNIFACADGYVSRIKMSPWGYGNVLYITHPNGYTTVYAHLQKFNKAISKYYQDAQYKNQKGILDCYPDSTALIVRKGEIIALSGNSGSSGGPHLHFEIRETESENPINPFLFGFKIKDNLKPRIQGIRIYSFKHDSIAPTCNKSHEVSGSNGRYKLKYGDTIILNGYDNYGIAVHSTDKLNDSRNICGIYNAKLFIDDKLIFEQEIEKLDFSTNRYMNAHTDYKYYKQTKKSYHKSFLEPNNKLKIYKIAINNGVFEVMDKSVNANYIITDVSGNISSIKFVLKRSKESLKSRDDGKYQFKNKVECCKASEFHSEGISCFFPEGTVYNNIDLKYSKAKTPVKAFSPLHKVHDKAEAVQSNFVLKIKSEVPEQFQDKATIVAYNPGNKYYNVGGEYKDGWVTVETRSFGNFSVKLDTVAPVIKPHNIYGGKIMTKNTEISVIATDNLTGVKELHGYIDGKWILMRYNRKKAKYYYLFSDFEVPKGNHEFYCYAIDSKGNKSEYRASFVR